MFVFLWPGSRAVRLAPLLSLLFVVSGEVVATPIPISGMFYGVRTIPDVPVAGATAVIRLDSNACRAWLPGWSASVTTPEAGVLEVNIVADLHPVFCFGGQVRPRDVSFVAPVAGLYTVRVTGGGLYDSLSPAFPPVPYVLVPFTSTSTLTVLGSPPAVVPVPVMSPLSIGLLGGVLALGGWFALRRRRA